MKLQAIRVSTAMLLALTAVLVLPVFAQAADEWGTIKGRVVWAGGTIPAPEVANVDKDKAHCLEKGPIYKDNLVINKENKGIRFALVWLCDAKDPKSTKWTAPIHPSLKKPAKNVVIDQPCCVFEPHVIGLRVGQTLIVKNSSPIAHNVQITSVGLGPNKNQLIPPRGQTEITGFVAKVIPTSYTCSIHPWMKGWIGTFSHPYFAVTDADGNFEIKNAPAGDFRLMVWHEEVGFVLMDGGMRGKVFTIKAGGSTDVGEIGLKKE
jgi:plastocyanin